MANIDKNLKQDMRELKYLISFKDYDSLEELSPKKANAVSIMRINGDLFYSELFKTPKKKLITVDYLINKIEKENIYKSFADNFNQLFEYITNKKIKVNAYPTSYGIGIFVAIGYRDNIKQTKENIDNFLQRTGIEYNTEYSEAGWVFRYKISKKKENIKIIDSMIRQSGVN